MNLIQHVQEGLRGALATLAYGNEPCVWEMFCSPDSGLTKRCLREGLNSIRIGLSSGFDLYKKEAYEVLKNVFKKQRPRKIWISPMCTLFCDWTNLNYYWYRPEELNKKRRRERQMLRRLVALLLWVSYMDPTVQLYWEWPRRCRGWKEPIVSNFFEQQLPELGHEVWDCRLDGCRYNLKNDDGMFIPKEWTIKTTDLDLHGNFRSKPCTKNHEHAWIQGELTNKTAYYPTNMCRSIARFWSQHLIPQRWFSMLWTAPIEINNAFKLAYAKDFADEDALSEGYSPGSLARDKELPDPQALPGSEDLPGSDQVREAGGEEEIEKEREVWRTTLNCFHRPAGHPTSKNLARMLQDAGVEKWKVKEALSFKCPYCEEARLGGTSSKQIPPASLRPLPRAWGQVGLDIGEWTVPNFDRRIKFILFIDMAARYKVTESLFDYAHGEVKTANADMVIQAITLGWLMDKPHPHVLIPDNAKTLMSQKVVDFMMEMGVEVIPPPDQESWAHGIVESAINLIKTTATKIHLSMPDMDPRLTLALATSALNSSEFHRAQVFNGLLANKPSLGMRSYVVICLPSNCRSLCPKGQSPSGLLQAEDSPTCDGLQEVSSCDTIQREERRKNEGDEATMDWSWKSGHARAGAWPPN